MEEVNRHAAPNIIKLLIGNKSDLEAKRDIKYEEGQSYAQYNQMQFLETSAKNSINVEQAFFALAEQILQNIVLFDDQTQNYQDKMQLQYGYSLEEKPKKKKSKCC